MYRRRCNNTRRSKTSHNSAVLNLCALLAVPWVQACQLLLLSGLQEEQEAEEGECLRCARSTLQPARVWVRRRHVSVQGPVERPQHPHHNSGRCSMGQRCYAGAHMTPSQAVHRQLQVSGFRVQDPVAWRAAQTLGSVVSTSHSVGQLVRRTWLLLFAEHSSGEWNTVAH